MESRLGALQTVWACALVGLMPGAPRAGRNLEPPNEHEHRSRQDNDGRPFERLVEGIRSKVEARLAEVLDAELATAQSRGAPVAAIVSAFRELTMRGGKRLRSGLVAIGFRAACPRGSFAPAIEACVALELLQTYLLIHDDWMDRDLVRRGGPAVHVALRRHFGSEHIGDASAILAGDLGSALAMRVLARRRHPPERAAPVLRYFAEMQLEVVSGQQLDLVARSSPIEALYALKTSSYSVRGPLRLGALVAGAEGGLLRAFDRVAHPLGIAFQHRDDLLGTFGDPAVTGKPIGNDIRHGKHTALVAMAKKRLRGSARAAFDAAFSNPRASERQVESALLALEACGVVDLLETRVQELVAEARSALHRARVPARTKVLLGSAITALVDRDA